jgi:soluble lytic murein transglycosylase-like protein
MHVVYHRRLGGWKRAWMLRIPACESTWNPYARNPSGSSGLYQFMPSTWAGTPYGHRPIFSAFWQPYAAAWMLDQGRTGEWVCD